MWDYEETTIRHARRKTKRRLVGFTGLIKSPFYYDVDEEENKQKIEENRQKLRERYGSNMSEEEMLQLLLDENKKHCRYRTYATKSEMSETLASICNNYFKQYGKYKGGRDNDFFAAISPLFCSYISDDELEQLLLKYFNDEYDRNLLIWRMRQILIQIFNDIYSSIIMKEEYDKLSLEKFSNTQDNKIKEKNNQLLLERKKLCCILSLIMDKKRQDSKNTNKKIKDIYSSITSKEEKLLLSKYSCEIPY